MAIYTTFTALSLIPAKDLTFFCQYFSYMLLFLRHIPRLFLPIKDLLHQADNQPSGASGALMNDGLSFLFWTVKYFQVSQIQMVLFLA